VAKSKKPTKKAAHKKVVKKPAPKPTETPIISPEKVPEKKAGRKSKYETHVEPRLESVKAWRRRGLTEKEICQRLGISEAALAYYKHDHLELLEALKEGLDDSVSQVENALFKTATGYDYEEDVVVGRGESAYVERLTKHQPGIPLAQFFYLVNRCPKHWQSIQNIRIANPDGTPLQNTVNVGLMLNTSEYAALPADKKIEVLNKKMALINGNGTPLNRLAPLVDHDKD